jgi:predicted nucleotidyltransferase
MVTLIGCPAHGPCCNNACNTWRFGRDLIEKPRVVFVALSLEKRDESCRMLEMKLLLENLPAALQAQGGTLARCLEAMGRTLHVRAIYLFGSHARGTAQPESDVDLCIVADDAERQMLAATRLREAIWEVWPRPAFTLVPISPARLAEKQGCHDHFFNTILKEGVLLATED